MVVVDPAQWGLVVRVRQVSLKLVQMLSSNLISMKKTSLYTYEDGVTTLQFQIMEGPDKNKQKKSFLAHLKNAVADLTLELDQDDVK